MWELEIEVGKNAKVALIPPGFFSYSFQPNLFTEQVHLPFCNFKVWNENSALKVHPDRQGRKDLERAGLHITLKCCCAV